MYCMTLLHVCCNGVSCPHGLSTVHEGEIYGCEPFTSGCVCMYYSQGVMTSLGEAPRYS